MARTNTAKSIPKITTHEGAPAARINPIQKLRRSVMSCLLWENEFYEDGVAIADRIGQTIAEVIEKHGGDGADAVSGIAREARQAGNLRHVPLLISAHLAMIWRAETKKRAVDHALKGGTIDSLEAEKLDSLVSRTIAEVIQRADELTEFLAIYAKLHNVAVDKIKPILSAQVKKGLAKAFQRFDAYQLAKYDRDGAIRLRDAMFLVHPRPRDVQQAEIWRNLIEGTLPAPDTWEVALSGGADKKETFTRLLQDGKLGYLALLRNLRNMTEAGVDEAMVKQAILDRKGAHRVLPFRFIPAAGHAPQYATALNLAMLAGIGEMQRLPGKTLVLVDVSGSMDYMLSSKSEMNRMDAAAALAAIIPCESKRVFTFSNDVVEVAAWEGLPGIDTIKRSQPHSGTSLGAAVSRMLQIPHDRLIVITDEQSQDRVPAPNQRASYMINVASAQNGVGYGKWRHIDGFSERVIQWIAEVETQEAIDAIGSV